MGLVERKTSIFPDCASRRFSEHPRHTLSSVNMNLLKSPCKRQDTLSSSSSRHPSLCLVTEQLMQARRYSCMSRLGTAHQLSASCMLYEDGGTIVEEGNYIYRASKTSVEVLFFREYLERALILINKFTLVCIFPEICPIFHSPTSIILPISFALS